MEPLFKKISLLKNLNVFSYQKNTSTSLVQLHRIHLRIFPWGFKFIIVVLFVLYICIDTIIKYIHLYII